jgi:hypothetical protein
MKLHLFSIILFVSATMLGCSEDIVQPPKGKGIELTLQNFAPSRSGEAYALWFAFPKSSIVQKGQQPQHGTLVFKLISTFDVDAGGNIIGLDTTNLEEKIGTDLALAVHAQVSVEQAGAVVDSPRVPFTVGEITGSASIGKATLTTAHEEAIGFDFLGVTGKATFASPTYAPNDYKGELYLMDATSPTSISNGLDKLPPLPTNWKYAMWVIDSSTESQPPFNIFYGYFLMPSGNDSNPNDNRFAYPGGRYPADTTQAVNDIAGGSKMNVYVSLEPNFGTARPQVPFGAVVLHQLIPKGILAFTPFTLTNTASKLPSAGLVINR